MPRQHLVDQGGDLELDALPHWKPVQLAQNWQDEVASVSAHYQLSSSVLGRLEASQQIVGGAAVPLPESSRLVMNACTIAFVAPCEEQRTTGRSCRGYRSSRSDCGHIY